MHPSQVRAIRVVQEPQDASQGNLSTINFFRDDGTVALLVMDTWLLYQLWGDRFWKQLERLVTEIEVQKGTNFYD